MSQNKIPVLIGEKKLFDTLTEIIDQINNHVDIKFEILFYDKHSEVSNSIIVADKFALKFFENNNIRKIYLVDNTKDLKANSQIKSEIILISMPFHVNELFERVSNDIQQELKNKKSIINFTTFSYDFNSRSLFDSKNSLRFTEKENEIFSCLLNYKNEPVSKKQLLKDIWQYDDQIE